MKNDLSDLLPDAFVPEHGGAVGITTPQANTTVEPEMQTLLGWASKRLAMGEPALVHCSTRAAS